MAAALPPASEADEQVVLSSEAHHSFIQLMSARNGKSTITGILISTGGSSCGVGRSRKVGYAGDSSRKLPERNWNRKGGIR